jgi:hypothetical protein
VTWKHTTASAALSAALLAACGTPPPSESLTPSVASPAEPVTLGSEEVELEAGTYQFDLTALSGGDEYPAFEATVPAGWTSSGGWAVARPGADGETPMVAVTFWNVDEVYGHPCQWEGTLAQPGPSVDDLVAALAEVPMRNPTPPVEVEFGGHPGTYLEWSVPSDLAFEDGSFLECDEDDEGNSDFRSWTGKGWASTRYQQAPGQVDRLWILDVDGARLVIDAFLMPDAPESAVDELESVVNSIRFLDD